MEKEFIELYAPHNAKSLTQEQIAAMANLTREQVKELAAAYPNSPIGKSYLILKDKTKPENKQTFPRSTWQNYFSLLKVGQTQFVPLTFVSLFKPNDAKLKVAPVQDLTKGEAKEALKTASLQSAKPSPSQELKTGEEQDLGKAKTAAEIAAEEGSGVEDKVNKKPLEKMNWEELATEYEKATGEVADPSQTKAVLLKAIQAKQ